MVSDTVGFIRDLPHELVAAFHATLEATADADLLLHVVDGANPARDEQMGKVDKGVDGNRRAGSAADHRLNKQDLTGLPRQLSGTTNMVEFAGFASVPLLAKACRCYGRRWQCMPSKKAQRLDFERGRLPVEDPSTILNP